MKKCKTAVTTRDYKIKAFGWDIVVPAGSRVSNRTAMGVDDNYHFWEGWEKQIQELTGSSNSILAHDLMHYGLNIPDEFCTAWGQGAATAQEVER